MSRHKRAQTRATIPLVDGLDWTVPWAILPATLTEIANVVSHGEIPQPTAALSDMEGRGASRTTGAVAVLSLRGVITPRTSWLSMLFGGGFGLDMFRQAFREALADDDITSILIEVDSPGGRVDLVPETADEIRAARGQKPIVAIANTMAASAAYWIASAADEFVVTPSGLVGSIGTYITHLETSKFDAELGFTYTLISAGKYKTDGNQLEPLSESAQRNFEEIVEAVQDLFVAGVADGRGVDEDTVRNGYGEGHVLPAEAALAEGMVDRIETYEQTVARLVAGRAPGARSPLSAATPATARLQAPVATPELALDAAAQADSTTLVPQQQAASSPSATPAPADASPSSPPPAEREAVTAGSTPEWQLLPTRRH